MEIERGFFLSKCHLPEGAPGGRFKEGGHTHISNAIFNPNFYSMPVSILISIEA
jgi:hypothetical protein